MNPNLFLEVGNVSHQYQDGINAIQEVSFAMQAGDFYTLVGPSGVGKSTLLRILGGLLRPTDGQVTVGGHPPEKTPHPIGIVFQQHNLMPWRTAYDNVRLPLELGRNGARRNGESVQELLELVGLAGFERSYPAQLSGGMAQRVALARALIHQPELLLLDEPFGALDALTRERMGQELLRIWQARPVTVFMVTHSIQEAVLLSDQILVMNDSPGQISDRFTVPLGRPRHVEMIQSPQFLECSAAVRAAIKG